MALKILFTEDSLIDLEHLVDYITAENPDAAERFATSLLNHVDLLKTFPRSGVPVPKHPGIRKLLHTPVSVYYRISPDNALIEILHFWHTARKPPAL